MTIPEIPKLGTKFWKELGGKIPGWIKDDALKGLMQDNRQKLRYKSETYKKYKANNMRRFGRDTGYNMEGILGKQFFKTGTKAANRNKKTGFTTGERLKDYRGVSIESNQTQFVDLTVTGRMINSLKVKQAGVDGVVMGFGMDQAGKVLGNKMHGYNVVGLNDKNRRLVKLAVVQEMKKRGMELPKKVVINIGV